MDGERDASKKGVLDSPKVAESLRLAMQLRFKQKDMKYKRLMHEHSSKATYATHLFPSFIMFLPTESSLSLPPDRDGCDIEVIKHR
ncbi:hypothetical protein L1987_38115 [Smallanthus sonchifolius]|uniref:Uncharacterized protein n=1 Tax=Smallanthus sonchifolius TaxID=185202 RepID=A0ACB9HJN6_9ASTR|nr:hypothetical protein L1987_38115 [Smallanthus sonchifolius]